MPKLIDLSGKQFGKLHVVQSDGQDNQGRVFWLCRCDCGIVKRVRGVHLSNGQVVTCGCDRRKLAAEKITRHGHSVGPRTTSIYTSWSQMHSRCRNPNHNRFHRYGGRGIVVCERWATFDNFLEDMGGAWRKGLSIDRINNDGNYEPANCKWSTPKEQANNKTNPGRVKAA